MDTSTVKESQQLSEYEQRARQNALDALEALERLGVRIAEPWRALVGDARTPYAQPAVADWAKAKLVDAVEAAIYCDSPRFKAIAMAWCVLAQPYFTRDELIERLNALVEEAL